MALLIIFSIKSSSCFLRGSINLSVPFCFSLLLHLLEPNALLKLRHIFRCLSLLTKPKAILSLYVVLCVKRCNFIKRCILFAACYLLATLLHLLLHHIQTITKLHKTPNKLNEELQQGQSERKEQHLLHIQLRRGLTPNLNAYALL